jgi:AP-3 complex subunit delta-1
VEWRQRNREDPFYIGTDGQNNAAAVHSGGNLDLDSIPIVDLKISSLESNNTPFTLPHNSDGKQPKKYEVIPDEVIGLEETLSVTEEPVRAKRTLLQVDSSGLRDFTLVGENQTLAGSDKVESKRVEDDMEMATAMKEVERIRLEMQRASERVHLEGTPSDGTLVKRKKKTKKSGQKTRGTDSGRLEEQKSSSGQKKSRIKDRVLEG